MGANFGRLLAEVQTNGCRKVELVPYYRTAELLQLIKALRSNTSVEELSLVKHKVGRPEVTTALGGMLGDNRSIKQLSLSNIGDEEFAEAFAVGLEQHTVLEGLRLMNCSFSNAGFQSIFVALIGCLNLSKLEMVCSPITDGAVTALSELLQFTPRLTELNLNCCSLASASLVELLSALANTSSLRTLSLRSDSLDEACATALCDVLCSHTSLNSLTVAFKPGALPLALDALVQHRSLRRLSLDLFAEDAQHIPDLLRAMGNVMEFELRTGALPQNLIGAIVKALRDNQSLLKFSLPGQQLSSANLLEIGFALRRNKEPRKAVSGRAPLRPVAKAATPPPVRRELPSTAAVALVGTGAPEASAAAAPTISPEELQDLVRSLRDMQCQLAQLQAAVQSQSSTLAPLSAEHHRRQTQEAALRVIQANQTARDYHEHVRLLLTCAYVGAAAICSGNVEGRGSGAATAGVLAVDQLPKLIAKGLGKAAESIPLVGVGGAALTALIKAADARKLNVKMQRVVQLGSTPGELTALVDCLARSLTLLQWGTVSSPDALVALVKGSGFRGWIKKLLGKVEAEALYIVKGTQCLNDAKKAALADVERFLKAVAVEQQGFSFECSPRVAGAEARAKVLTLRAVKLLLNRASYDEQLPLNAAAVPFVPLNVSAVPFVPR